MVLTFASDLCNQCIDKRMSYKDVDQFLWEKYRDDFSEVMLEHISVYIKFNLGDRSIRPVDVDYAKSKMQLG